MRTSTYSSASMGFIPVGARMTSCRGTGALLRLKSPKMHSEGQREPASFLHAPPTAAQSDVERDGVLESLRLRLNIGQRGLVVLFVGNQ